MRIFGKPKPARPVDVINGAARGGIGIARFRISIEDGRRIQKLEKRDPNAALAELLRVLYGQAARR